MSLFVHLTDVYDFLIVVKKNQTDAKIGIVTKFYNFLDTMLLKKMSTKRPKAVKMKLSPTAKLAKQI